MTQHPEDFGNRDLNPDPTPGQNYGASGEEYETNAPTAADFNDIYDLLPDWSDDELKRLIVLPERARLQQGATYFDLLDPGLGEFTARGDMVAMPGSRIIPKDSTDYVIWNKLTSTRARR